VTIAPFKLNMRIDQVLKQFIFAQADDFLANFAADHLP
jgi:type I restriction enzyme, R subunit